MCGIVAYIGKRQASPILIEGLKRLEYRGYDSAGIATVSPALTVSRVMGKVAGLEVYRDMAGTLGIGHTRWATHGEPSERNAHPHRSGGVAVVHNGIIENYEHLRRQLRDEGFAFTSDTDTEVLPHLIEREFRRGARSLEDAVTGALAQVEGAYAIAVVSQEYPDEMVGACNSSPLVVGIGTDELFLASDELAFGGAAGTVAHLKDGEVIVLKRNGTYTFRGVPLGDVAGRLEKPSMSEQVDKNGHAHYMHKEIFEQPQAMCNALASHLKDGQPITFGGLTGDIEARLADTHRIQLVGCGTSLFAAMAGKLLIERVAGVHCDAEQAAEFSYREPLLTSQDTVIGISQSGETADTLRAMAVAKEHHALCLSITNRVGSTLAKRTGLGMFLHAGPEIAVASTKAFTSQVAMLALFAGYVAQLRGRQVPAAFLKALRRLPELLEETLAREEEIKAIALKCAGKERMIVVGRGSAVPLALEAALKIREIAYLDAHGLSAAELKHGTLALVEPGTPVVVLMPTGALRDKIFSNIEEVRARGGRVIALEPPPGTPDELVSIVLAPLVQLLSYHLGVVRGNDVDQPRNLAKSVTVE
ncbi:MAG: glutamine--fructose-6-phosphate transaminase (isomerizing) [Patescibacteria group bacterium]